MVGMPHWRVFSNGWEDASNPFRVCMAYSLVCSLASPIRYGLASPIWLSVFSSVCIFICAMHSFFFPFIGRPTFLTSSDFPSKVEYSSLTCRLMIVGVCHQQRIMTQSSLQGIMTQSSLQVSCPMPWDLRVDLCLILEVRNQNYKKSFTDNCKSLYTKCPKQ